MVVKLIQENSDKQEQDEGIQWEQTNSDDPSVETNQTRWELQC